jgi:hypothetical protein
MYFCFFFTIVIFRRLFVFFYILGILRYVLPKSDKGFICNISVGETRELVGLIIICGDHERVGQQPKRVLLFDFLDLLEFQYYLVLNAQHIRVKSNIVLSEVYPPVEEDLVLDCSAEIVKNAFFAREVENIPDNLGRHLYITI